MQISLIILDLGKSGSPHKQTNFCFKIQEGECFVSVSLPVRCLLLTIPILFCLYEVTGFRANTIRLYIGKAECSDSGQQEVHVSPIRCLFVLSGSPSRHMLVASQRQSNFKSIKPRDPAAPASMVPSSRCRNRLAFHLNGVSIRWGIKHNRVCRYGDIVHEAGVTFNSLKFPIRHSCSKITRHTVLFMIKARNKPVPVTS